MNTVDADEIFVCSFCEQKLKIQPAHVGRRIACPKCARMIRLFPNRTRIIDNLLVSSWFYKRPRLLRSEEEVGPLSDEQFIPLVLSGEISATTDVRSPRLTKDQWLPADRIDRSAVQELIDQRRAEEQRRLRLGIKREEIARKNREILAKAIADAIADGTVSLKERTRLFEFATAAGIPESEVESTLKNEATRLLQAVIEDALGDGILEPHEKERISDLATGLGLDFELSPTQSMQMTLCEFAWSVANGTFEPEPLDVSGFKLNAKESALLDCKVEWFEVSQQKKAGAIALGNGHFLASIAIGNCILTNKRIVLLGQFTSKKVPLLSVEFARWFRDGLFCNRSTGKSVFLKPTASSLEWKKFAMLVQYTISQEPVQGIEPEITFIPDQAMTRSDNSASSYIQSLASEALEPRYTFRVVGDHVGDRSFWIDRLRPRDPIYLRREPANAFDPNAISVVDANQNQLGYLKREVAEWFAPILERRRFQCEAFRRRESGALIVGVYEL